MTIIQSIILGIIQGITEFLPVSSSAHLEVVADLMNTDQHTILFDISLHFSTLLVVLIYFRKKIFSLLTNSLSQDKKCKQDSKQMIIYIILSSLPVIAFYFLADDYIDTLFKSTRVISVNLIVFGIFLVAIDRVFKYNKKTIYDITPTHALGIGVLQSLALIRGVSRSGIMILGGGMSKLKKKEATEFAFLAGIPVIGGSFVLQVYKLVSTSATIDSVTPLIVGFVSAFISGYIAVDFLFKFLKKHNFAAFGYYRILLGVALLLFLK